MMPRIPMVATLLVLNLSVMATRASAADDCRVSGLRQKAAQAFGSVAGGTATVLLGRVGVRSNDMKRDLTGMFSSQFACALSAAERRKAAAATQAALNAPPSAAPQTWTSDQNPAVSGTVTVGANVVTASGEECRSATNVGYVNGKEVRDVRPWCRTPPGTAWAPKAA